MAFAALLCLFEGVVTGAADGYARMAEKPAATLLHLGPGLANGLANIHNASRARSPMINVVGEHATYHLRTRRAAHRRYRDAGAAIFALDEDLALRQGSRPPTAPRRSPPRRPHRGRSPR